MKKFTKLFLSCTAVAALAVAMGTAAMAASVSGDVAGSFDEDAGTLTLTTTLSDTATILVLDQDADVTAVTDDDILYIDQTSTGSFGTMGLLGGTDLADGKYPILVGYYDDDDEFAILNGTLTIGDVATVLIGDVSLDEKVTLTDATLIVRHYAGSATITDETALAAADTSGDDKITLGDATCIVMYYVGNTDRAGNVGSYK